MTIANRNLLNVWVESLRDELEAVSRFEVEPTKVSFVSGKIYALRMLLEVDHETLATDLAEDIITKGKE